MVLTLRELMELLILIDPRIGRLLKRYKVKYQLTLKKFQMLQRKRKPKKLKKQIIQQKQQIKKTNLLKL